MTDDDDVPDSHKHFVLLTCKKCGWQWKRWATADQDGTLVEEKCQNFECVEAFQGVLRLGLSNEDPG